MLARSVIWLALSVGVNLYSNGEAPPMLTSGSYAPSPDGEFYVFYEPLNLEIRDSKTSDVVRAFDWETPAQALCWTRDSKTLIVVHHIAHGSDASFVHWDGHDWRVEYLVGPFEHLPAYHSIAVVGVRPGYDTVDFTFKTHSPTQLVSFTFVPATGKFRKLRRRAISFERWKQLPMFPLGATNASNQALQPTPLPVALLFCMSYPRVMKPCPQRRG